MIYEKLIEPQEIRVDNTTFAISKIPAIKAIPIYNEISRLFSTRGVLGLSEMPERLCRDMLGYVLFKADGDSSWNTIDTDTSFNRAFPNYKVLIEVEIAMVKENFDFLLDGSLLELLEGAAPALEASAL